MKNKIAKNKSNVISINPKSKPSHIQAVVAGRAGFAYSVISKITGLSLSQVKRQLVNNNSQVGKYRRAESEFAKGVLQATNNYSAELLRQIRTKMNKIKG